MPSRIESELDMKVNAGYRRMLEIEKEMKSYRGTITEENKMEVLEKMKTLFDEATEITKRMHGYAILLGIEKE